MIVRDEQGVDAHRKDNDHNDTTIPERGGKNDGKEGIPQVETGHGHIDRNEGGGRGKVGVA